MISRIACLIGLLALRNTLADPIASPPVVTEAGHTRIIQPDLAKPQPEAILSQLWQLLESERTSLKLTPERRDQIDVAEALIETQRKNFRKATVLLAAVGEQSLLYDAARFYRAQALRLLGEESTNGAQPSAGLSPCQEARTILLDLSGLGSGPFTELTADELPRITLCYAQALVGLRKYTEAKPFLQTLLSSETKFDPKQSEFLYHSLITVLKRDKEFVEARKLYEEARAQGPQAYALAALASDLPPLPAQPEKPTKNLEQPETRPLESEDEALFRTALKQLSKKDQSLGVETLVKIQNDFPGSVAARKAGSRLRALATNILAEPKPPAYFLKSVKKLPTEPLYTLARGIWEDGHDKEAEELFRQLIDTAPKHPMAGNFYYSMARIQENNDDWKGARTNFEKVVREHSASPFFDRAHFKVGWLSYLLKEDVKARDWLEANRAMTQDTSIISQDLYWLAKLFERQGKSAESKKYFEAIPKVAPLSFYSFVSEQIPGVAPPPSLAETRPRAFWNAFRLERARAFLGAGLPTAAASVLRDFDLETDPAASEEVALLATYAGLNGYAFSLAAQLASLDAEGNLSQRLTSIMFPRPMEETIRTEAATQGVDPFLVFSLIKQESAFREDAESHAGAKGLMQLMPQTARQIAKDLKEPPLERNVLFSGAVSIKYGTFYLSNLLKNYSGNIVLALAAYNAGTQRVDAWLAQWKDQPPDVFVELIPFEETRNYVKAVTRNFALYSRLYSNRVIRLADVFPPPPTK